MDFYRVHARDDVKSGFYGELYGSDERLEELAEKLGKDWLDLRGEFLDKCRHPEPSDSADLKKQIEEKFFGRYFSDFYYGFDTVDKLKKWFNSEHFLDVCAALDLVVSYFSFPDDTMCSDKNQTLVHRYAFEDAVDQGEFVTMEVKDFT